MTEFYTYVYFTLEDASIPTYVGKGKNKRYAVHMRAKSHFGNHLRKQLESDTFPLIVRFNQPSEEAAFTEEIRLIAKYGRKDLGSGTLYNKTDGGDGLSGCQRGEVSSSTRNAISKAITKVWEDPDEKARRVESLKKAWADPDKRKHRLEVMKAVAARTPLEVKQAQLAKAWETRRANKRTPEQIEIERRNRSEAAKRRNIPLEVKQAQCAKAWETRRANKRKPKTGA